MKRSTKALILLALVIALAVSIAIPTKAKTVRMGGNWGYGPFGKTCWCPVTENADCFCDIEY